MSADICSADAVNVSVWLTTDDGHQCVYMDCVELPLEELDAMESDRVVAYLDAVTAAAIAEFEKGARKVNRDSIFFEFSEDEGER